MASGNVLCKTPSRTSARSAWQEKNVDEHIVYSSSCCVSCTVPPSCCESPSCCVRRGERAGCYESCGELRSCRVQRASELLRELRRATELLQVAGLLRELWRGNELHESPS